MRRRIAFSFLLLVGGLFPHLALAQGINPIPLIIQDESSGNPTAQNPGSTSSGLFGDINSTWAAALAACGCGTTAQFPTAASAPASVQIAANDALINQNGLSDWLCPNCDPAFAAQVAAAGGAGAFQTSGLSTNPADFTAADTPGGLASFLAGDGGTSTGTPLSTGGGVSTAAGGGAATGGSAAGTSLTTGVAPSPQALTSLVGDAAPPTSGILDQIVQEFGTLTASWQAKLATIASDLFWILAGIELAVLLISLMMSGNDWRDAVATLILPWLLPIGLFYWLLTNGSTFMAAIINSMRMAGAAVGGNAITPSGILSAGIDIVSQAWQFTSIFFHPGIAAAEMFILVPIMFCFAMMAVWFAATLIEAYFVMGAASLFLAFAGMRWSRNIGISVLLYSLGVGAKLFAMEAIVAVTTQYIQKWMAATAELTFQGLFTALGFSIFLAALAKTVPDLFQRMVLQQTSSMAHYQPVIRQAAGVGAMAAAPVLGVAGGAALMVQAFRYAAEQIASEQQSGQGRTASGMLTGAGQAIASAAGSEISGRLGGIYRGGAAASLARMSSNVGQQRRVAAAQAARPVAPAAPTPTPAPTANNNNSSGS